MGEDRHSHLRFLAEEAARFGVDVLCWCLLSNHIYFVAVPHQEISLARAFGEAASALHPPEELRGRRARVSLPGTVRFLRPRR